MWPDNLCQPLIGICFAHLSSRKPASDLSKSRCSMLIESTFFYFVLLTLLSVILNALAARLHRWHDGHSHA